MSTLILVCRKLLSYATFTKKQCPVLGVLLRDILPRDSRQRKTYAQHPTRSDPTPSWSQACTQSVCWKSLTQLIECNGLWIGPFREQVTLHFLILLISGRHRHFQNPLLSTRWVRSQYCPQIKQQREKFSAEPGFEPRAAGLEARMLPLCKAAPSIPLT